jgi:hypothetical protein
MVRQLTETDIKTISGIQSPDPGPDALGFGNVTPQNFAQIQQRLPALQQFTGFEGFARFLQNPSANPAFVESIRRQLGHVDVGAAPAAQEIPEVSGPSFLDLQGPGPRVLPRTSVPGVSGGARIPVPPPQLRGGGGPVVSGPTTLGGPPGGFGGGGGGGFTFGGGPTQGIPSIRSTLQDFFGGREALVSQGIEDLSRFGARGVERSRAAIPELRLAAEAAQGVLGGGDLGDLFSQALGEAASIRGIETSQIGDFDAALASESFLPQAGALAARTGFEGLQFGGFVPPQNITFGTLGSLSLQTAQQALELQAGITQSLQSQAMFQSLLPGLMS